jgi:signal recognition particle receptor subunit beta
VAALDPHDQAIVISVVYDGPPEAGKTTSVRALARSFGREVYTPEERNGRTVFFDWLEHTGGRFEGAPIRCQIASVPGQKRWTRRRGHFLDRADVVVFVGDTSADGWAQSVSRLQELRAGLDRREGPPVGIVFQANKRDAADAIAIAEVRRRVGSERIAVIETVANDGSGVREAFVFAVRLALDRVREEQQRGNLPWHRAGLGSGEELLDVLRRLDIDHREAPPDEPPSDEPAIAGGSAPRPPSHDAPCGFVWPPIEGRIVLREAASHGGTARVTTSGDCVAGLGSGWRLHSSADAVYTDLDEGRAALISWARQHAAAQGLLSRRRCIVLAETGEGRWRLWQVVQREPSLRELVADAGAVDTGTAQRLLAEASALSSSTPLRLSCTLDTVGVTEAAQPIYVGLVPR